MTQRNALRFEPSSEPWQRFSFLGWTAFAALFRQQCEAMEGWNNGIGQRNKNTMHFILERKGYNQRFKNTHFMCAFAPTIPAFHYAVSDQPLNSVNTDQWFQWLVGVLLKSIAVKKRRAHLPDAASYHPIYRLYSLYEVLSCQAHCAQKSILAKTMPHNKLCIFPISYGLSPHTIKIFFS